MSDPIVAADADNKAAHMTAANDLLHALWNESPERMMQLGARQSYRVKRRPSKVQSSSQFGSGKAEGTNYELLLRAARKQIAEKDRVESLRVSRDPCFKCGVRSDWGCQCS